MVRGLILSPLLSILGEEVVDKNHVELYTDGSSLGNPGPSGYGFIARYWNNDDDSPKIYEHEYSIGFRLSTNNRMELGAVIEGINYIIYGINQGYIKNVNQIDLTSDSKYFCDAINNDWIKKWARNGWITSTQKAVKNIDLWEMIIQFQSKLKDLNIKLKVNHILGHNGHEFNERADKLCTAASRDIKNHLTDVVYENSIKNKK